MKLAGTRVASTFMDADDISLAGSREVRALRVEEMIAFRKAEKEKAEAEESALWVVFMLGVLIVGFVVGYVLGVADQPAIPR